MSTPDLNPARLAAAGGASDRKLRVLVVDDHEVVHWGLRLMLGEQPWVERCLSARNTEEALAMTKRYEPHVALVDLFVGQESGATICERLREVVPPPNVVGRLVSCSRTTASRSCWSKGRPRRTTASTTEKMAVPAPMPRARTMSATAVKVGDWRSERRAVLRSSNI